MTSVGNPHGKATKPLVSSVKEPEFKNVNFNLEVDELMDIDSLVAFSEGNPNQVFGLNDTEHRSMCCIGNNLYFLSWLAQNGYRSKISCVYADPPFGTNQVFVSSEKTSSYSDKLSGAQYLEFQMRRFRLLYLLLREGGIFYLHIDENMLYHQKLLMDKVFGNSGFMGMITRRKCSSKNSTTKGVGDVADYVLIYAKGGRDMAILDRIVYPWTEDSIKKEFPKSETDSQGNERKFKLVPVSASGTRNGKTGGLWRGNPPPDGKHWNPNPDKLDELEENGYIYWSSNGNPRKKVYLDESIGKRATNIVTEYRDAYNQNSISCGYPTEKNSDFVRMLIEAASKEGEIVLDPYCGSGTTMVASSQIKRRFIGIDMGIDAWRHYFRRLTKGEILQKNLESLTHLMEDDIPNLQSKLTKNSIEIYSDSEYISDLNELIEVFTQLAN